MKNRTMMVALLVCAVAMVGVVSFVNIGSDADISLSDETLKGQGYESQAPGERNIYVEYHETGSKYILKLVDLGLNYPLAVKVAVVQYPYNDSSVVTVVFETDGRIALSKQTPVLMKSSLSKTGTVLYDVIVYEYDGVTELDRVTLLVKQYEVTFDANGGVGSDEKSIFDYDTVFDLPAAGSFYKDYHTFEGYSKTQDGPVVDPTAFNKNTVLYASYAPGTYRIIFDGADPTGGSITGSMPAMTMTYGVGKNLDANAFSVLGFTFTGWNGGGATYSDGQFVKDICTDTGSSPIVAGDVTLTAQWSPYNFSIVYDGNRPSEATSDVTDVPAKTESQNYNTSVNAATKPTLTGWTFLGWSTIPSGDVAYNEGDPLTHIQVEKGKDFVLYAKWQAITYTIAFDINKPNGAHEQGPGDDYTQMDPMSATYDMVQRLSANTYLIDGWTFVGWNLDSGGNGAGFYDQQSAKFNLTTTPGDTVTLKAQWNVAVYEITVVKEVDSEPLTFSYTKFVSGNTPSDRRAMLQVTSATPDVYFVAKVNGETSGNYLDSYTSYSGLFLIKNIDRPLVITIKQEANPYATGNVGRFAITEITNGTENTLSLFVDGKNGNALPSGSVSLTGVYFETMTIDGVSTYGFGNIKDNLSGAHCSWEVRADNTYVDPQSGERLQITGGWNICDAKLTSDLNIYSAKAMFTLQGETDPSDETAWTIWTVS